MSTILLTGFPGFLASALAPKLLERFDRETSVTCLVQPHYRPLAERRAAEIASRNDAWRDRIKLVDGDVTRPGLVASVNGSRLEDQIREVYHFAAVYDLAVPRKVGVKVNVAGTANVLDFIGGCPRFERLHYVSTCFVSGRHPGRFTENDLAVGQSFNNSYEETKYLAEIEVQNRMRSGLAATIYRPSIVVGDSRTGATQKYDGPYVALQWILRWNSVAPMICANGAGECRVNIVPRDFVIAAVAHLSGSDASRGRVYQICDPHPSTVDELFEVFGRATGRRIVQIRLPAAIAKGALKHVPGIERWTRIPPESVDYFTHPTEYVCDNTLRDLEGTGIACPAFRDYAAALVRFMQQHPQVDTKGMQ